MSWAAAEAAGRRECCKISALNQLAGDARLSNKCAMPEAACGCMYKKVKEREDGGWWCKVGKRKKETGAGPPETTYVMT